MLTVYLENGGYGRSKIIDIYSPISGKQLMEKLVNTLEVKSDYYFLKYNGRLVELDNIICDGVILLEPKLCGGKGGFGSMLRAIGAQIEKTTNREACRDLSGRRLRDINEEKRLKAWIEKQSTRDEEAAERKKKKLEKLCAVPKHEFKDKSYDEQRSGLTERIEDAVEAGFANASSSAVKRAADQNTNTNVKKKKKTILDLDDEIDSDDLDSSDDSSDDKEIVKNTSNVDKVSKTENSSDVVSHSSDDSSGDREIVKNTSNVDNVSKTENSSDIVSHSSESSNISEKLDLPSDKPKPSNEHVDDTSR